MPRFGGRQKGTPNKLGPKIKNALEAALDSDGGPEAFFRTLKATEPAIFCRLIEKCIPSELNVASLQTVIVESNAEAPDAG